MGLCYYEAWKLYDGCRLEERHLEGLDFPPVTGGLKGRWIYQNGEIGAKEKARTIAR